MKPNVTPLHDNYILPASDLTGNHRNTEIKTLKQAYKHKWHIVVVSSKLSRKRKIIAGAN